MKKKTLVIVISVLVVLLIVAGVLTYLFLGTDVFKSDKELFAKYSSQVVTEDEFFPTALKDYETKKNMVAYESNGTISANSEIIADTSADTTLQEVQSLIGYANNTNITFNGKVDKTNKKVEENFVVNYTDTVNFPFTIKQDGDRYGILVNGISETNYVAVDNSNLPGLLQSLGATDVTGVPDKLEMPDIESLNLSDEEKTHINETYLTPMFNGITEDKFTKIKNDDGTVSYVLNISAEEVKAILSQMLQTLSTDTTMIDKLNSIYTELEGDLNLEQNVQSDLLTGTQSSLLTTQTTNTITSENILAYKNEIDAQTWSGNVKLTVTESKKATTKFAVELTGVEVSSNSATNTSTVATDNTNNTDIILFEISKEQTNSADSNIAYTITGAYNGTTYITTNLGYADLNTNNPKETITVTVGDPNYLTTTYTFNKNVTFGNEVVIDGFNDSTTVVINNYSSNQLLPFLIQYASSLVQLNTNQMTQIGYPTDGINPLFVWIAAPATSLDQVQTMGDELSSTSMSEQETAAYNAEFTSYEGNITGANAKTLVDTVKQHNLVATDNSEKIQVLTTAGNSIVNVSEVSISNTDGTYLDTVNASLQATSTYNVSFGYDQTSNKITTIYITDLGATASTGTTETTTNSVTTSTNSILSTGIEPMDY